MLVSRLLHQKAPLLRICSKRSHSRANVMAKIWYVKDILSWTREKVGTCCSSDLSELENWLEKMEESIKDGGYVPREEDRDDGWLQTAKLVKKPFKSEFWMKETEFKSKEIHASEQRSLVEEFPPLADYEDANLINSELPNSEVRRKRNDFKLDLSDRDSESIKSLLRERRIQSSSRNENLIYLKEPASEMIWKEKVSKDKSEEIVNRL
ncbi:unnamed protein product [Dimorphilus gyrociliatus]|uniref:Uncharacterized protein n=1 Tax=Dimorphilus gyrociliatus TaxID=2664684 RepID=A0A7I8WEU1_9ANNE|nr:unnamed protein product [Dimorphilus gyrociliatus]